jgi:hypothetical protein
MREWEEKEREVKEREKGRKLSERDAPRTQDSAELLRASWGDAGDQRKEVLKQRKQQNTKNIIKHKHNRAQRQPSNYEMGLTYSSHLVQGCRKKKNRDPNEICKGGKAQEKMGGRSLGNPRARRPKETVARILKDKNLRRFPKPKSVSPPPSYIISPPSQ